MERNNVFGVAAMHDLQFAEDLPANGGFGIYQDDLSMMRGPKNVRQSVTREPKEGFLHLLCHQRLGWYVHHFGDRSPVTLTELSDDLQVLLSQLDLALSTVKLEVGDLLCELSMITGSRALSDGGRAFCSSDTIYWGWR